MERQYSTITEEQLLEFGMIKTVGDPIESMRKVISVVKDEDQENEGEIAIAVTHMRNQSELALMLPDGGCIYLSCATIEDLKTFEQCIESWEPSY